MNEHRGKKEGSPCSSANFLRRLKPHALFWGVYTVVFLLFRAALPFTLPFLAGLLLAVLLRPLRRLLHRQRPVQHLRRAVL